ncbi:signal peptidase I [Candidatus Roizmanbacteria bacterium RIFCSPHIGHO2_02_FULL_40_13b]|uniref:Signal peptidase I n=1 Tax=Candidatus Roizmanbacteria bacterium RIFCSPHIGHO2_01_FULL_39_24 TaxID=1802032 RepID=A0A1F7GH81_9BACT|nr:MAG: signal peptidase I [Candidatus Roizmanbacteria bacterium RIFCSPHIGHO2_01_FULL_39_24]OGK27187.1 MAG: signal peptidase I [Candidatus Roizmanbacteria bacterium RIFCSPHIGHO2_02_FULL_40_13b]OGK49514.1 MAG: signal peptidase I [Candidatus Roizmanbacteria bacterium RIFCSPLOWO2_01_FULL_40_32]OGK57538.1 MAG: signal peptidase I [Candidatus Roizmanbacteria bacterium RIFCSPLOWO2_02_FULL_39_8]
MNTIKKILFSVLLVLYAMVFFVFITSRSGFISNIRSFVVVTGSMEPNMPVGTLVFTKPQPSYTENDIVAFEKDGRTITHRIVKVIKSKSGTSYSTKGDANNAPDTMETTSKSIYGKSIFPVPYVGSAVTTLRTVPGFIVFILIPALIFIAFEFKNIKEEIVKETEKRFQHKDAETSSA